jgi:hypothetical protein
MNRKDRIRKDYSLTWWFDFGRASIREVGRRPNISGIQRQYWGIAKITGTLFDFGVCSGERKQGAGQDVELESLEKIRPQVFCLDASRADCRDISANGVRSKH